MKVASSLIFLDSVISVAHYGNEHVEHDERHEESSHYEDKDREVVILISTEVSVVKQKDVEELRGIGASY